MDSNKTSIDEILLEVELSAKPSSGGTDPDIDRLLRDILKEKFAPEPPSADPLPQTPPPAPREEKPTRPAGEPPTRVFKAGSLRRQVRPAAPQAAPKAEPPFFRKAEAARRAAVPFAAAPQAPKAPEPAPKKAPAAPPSPPLSETGWFSIDVDAIRAEQPAPRPIPAQNLDDPPAEAPVDLLGKKLQRPPEAERSAEEFAPCFRRAGTRIAAEEPAMQEPLLRREARNALLTGLAVGALTAMILFVTILIGVNRSADPAFLPKRLTLGVLVFLGAAAGGLSWEMVGGGLFSLIRLRPDRNTLPATGYLLCMLQALGQLLFPKGLANPGVQIYLAAGTLLLCTGWLSRAMTFRTAAINARFALSDYKKFVPAPVDDSRAAGEFTKGLVDGTGVPAVNCPAETLDGFLPISLAADRSDRTARGFALTGLILGAAGALAVFFLTKSKNLAATTLVALCAVLAPMGNGFALAFPLRRGAGVLNRLSAFAAGERSIRDYSAVNAAVVSASDLIPPSSVTLSGIKTFAGMRIDEAILDAASLLIEAGSVLSDVFLGIIARRTELLRKVDAMTYEDGMGLSGWIENRRILIGNRALMAAHGIRAPSEDYERRFRDEGSDLVYLAASGELTAVFVITLAPSPEVDDAVQLLVENDVLLSVHTTDSLVTADRLAALYLCDRSCFKILPARLHEKFAYYRQPVKQKPASAANNGSIESLAASLAAPRRTKVMASMGWVIRLVSVILGTALVLMLSFLGALGQLSPAMLCGWMILWLLLELLAQRLVRIR